VLSSVAALRAAARAASESAVVWAPLGAPRVRWTFGQLLDDALRMAYVLAARFPAGQALGLQAPSSGAWVVFQHAAALAGIRLVAIPPALPPEPTAATACRTGCLTVIRERELLELLEVVPGAPRPLPAIDSTAIAQVQLTSGTSTEPRGVLLPHAALTGQATALADALEIRRTDVILNPNPLFHVSGQFFSLAALARGACQIVAPYEPEHLLDVMATERSTMLGLPPALLAPLLDAWEAAPRDVSALRVVALGGMTVPDALVARGERLWDARFCTGYGLTEAGGLTHVVRPTDPAHRRHRTVGRGLRGVHTRIVGAAGGCDLEAGRVGQIEVRVLTPMAGYAGDPEATREALTDDGWLRTGDLGYATSDGFLTITGRASERIIRAGATVSAIAVEATLLEHPQVLDAVVVGLPHPRDGQHVGAQVVIRPGVPPTLADLREHCAHRLPPSAIPDRIDIVAAVPRTGLGKPRRGDVRARMQRHAPSRPTTTTREEP
jgi:fatty-acyl-CoA synthase